MSPGRFPIGESEDFLKETYVSGLSSERQEIIKDYKATEDAVNLFYEGKADVEPTVKTLGDQAIGRAGEKSSVQIYAFEQMLKMLAEIDPKDEDKIETVLSEAIFDAGVAAHESPMKRVFYLGILQYFSDPERLARITEESEDLERAGEKPNQQMVGERRIIENVLAGTIRLLAKERSGKGGLVSEQEKVLKYISRGFPKDGSETEYARLVANYYGKEAHATRVPDTGSKIIDEWKVSGLPVELKNGVPDRVYLLPRGHRPSREKLKEADTYGIELYPAAASVEDSRKYKYVLVNVLPQDFRKYVDHIRDVKDRLSNLTRGGPTAERLQSQLDDLEERFKDLVWSHLDDVAKQQLGDKKDVFVLMQTIRDMESDLDKGEIDELLNA